MRRSKTLYIDGQRSSIGSNYVEEASYKLTVASLRECTLYVDSFEAKDLLDWFFEAKLLDQLRAIHGVSPIAYHHEIYPLTTDVGVVLDFDRLDVPTINRGPWFTPDMVKCAPLLEVAKQAQEIRNKYARVRFVLRWFNCNATIGAIRAIWPAVLALCPDAPALQELKEKPPTRYTTPKDIGVMLPLIRETANTVAAMGLIPADVKPRMRSSVYLQLAGSREEYEGATYYTEALSVNL